MVVQDTITPENIRVWLKTQEEKTLLRFITCGSVDDGKSTLIGRLLRDSGLIFEDRLAALVRESKKPGSPRNNIKGNNTGGDSIEGNKIGGGNIDYALLLDGLQAEREQGITIDVAHVFFSTDKRKFIVADTPGHEQYTRNMATGASTAELAIILVDARKGVLTQTRRHSFIVSLQGIKNIVLAVNKMDLVDYAQDRFQEIKTDYAQFATKLGLENITYLPISALEGDNIIAKSPNMPWYDGETLIKHLESVDNKSHLQRAPFRMPVQWVNRPGPDFRGFSGSVVSGCLKPGDEIRVAPNGKTGRVKTITTFDGDLAQAEAGQAITITLQDEIDISRGDLLAAPKHPPAVANQFIAHLIWMAEDEMLPGRRYLLKMGGSTVNAQISELKHKVNVNTLEHLAAKTLDLNEVGYVSISLDKELAFDPFEENRHTGSFILIDRFSNATIGAGMIQHPLRRATNIHWQTLDVDKQKRGEAKDQKPAILWFTGLSGSGKSTIANIVEKKLHAMGKHTYMLDGDNLRHGLNKDLGFTDADRVENIRRIAETSKLFVDAGLIVLTSFISPFISERRMARQSVGAKEFLEIFVDTPLGICEQRDPKGLYKKARAGEIKNFTGIDSDYETPQTAEITLKTDTLSAEEAADHVIKYLQDHGYIRG